MNNDQSQFTTNYAKAWNAFIDSSEYRASVDAMVAAGMKQPYVDNILRSAFEAGWNATGKKINLS